MVELCVFAGTSEGRRLVEFLRDQPVRVHVCVATEYGEALIPAGDNVDTSAGRLDEAGMEALLGARRFDLVVDVTHPFATRASECIAAACARTGTEYLRLNRAPDVRADGAVCVGSVREAAEYLAAHPGNALLTTGAKELAPYAAVKGFSERFYVRVLPARASLEACEAAGFPPAHVIAMQGPFSVELNEAMLRAVRAEYLVTKDSGDSGGFGEKLEAARRAGAKCVVIGRPAQPDGLDYAGVIRNLTGRYGLRSRREVAVVGVGMGMPGTMTREAGEALEKSECLIGAARMLEAAAPYGKPGFAEVSPERIVECMRSHPEYRRFAVLLSGDPGFYSGAKKLLPLLAGDEVRVIPGLSTLQVLCARLGTAWDDAKALSLHGRPGSVVPDLKRFGKVFALLDGGDAVRRVCEDLIDAGMGDAFLGIGERLGYPDEKITRGSALELREYECAPLCAVLLERPAERRPLPVGLPDEAFLRQAGDGAEKPVPMTKSEVRALCISKLRLAEDAVVWDVGAGTGSVSVEVALNCPAGRVYAVECREDAAALIERNARRFALRNLTVVRGTAPQALGGLPAPTYAFIGGSSGNMREIVEAVLARNPGARIVATAIALETLAELADIAAGARDRRCEITQVTIARSKPAGRYHLMSGMNPVWLAALWRDDGGVESEG